MDLIKVIFIQGRYNKLSRWQGKDLLKMAAIKITKEDWIEDYACRIFEMWRKRQGPLGQVDEKYIEQLKEQLSNQFDDPLKRALIENTY